MKRIGRSRKGFTLVEIVLVIAIIVILASVSFVGIKAMLNNANKNSTAVELHAGAWYVEGSAGQEGYYPYLIGGSTKYVKVVPKGTPDAKYWSDWDDMYAQVNAINVVTPMPQGGGYNPGGSGGLNPGTGGSGGNPVDPGTGGGDNPGGNPGGGDNPGGGGAQNPVTPDDPMWNGHPESWWDEHDAEIEKKIQEAISKGVNPDDIKVTRDPETGHITNYVIPAIPGGSGSGNGNGNGNGNGSGNSSTPSVGADSATVTLNAPSEYNLQAQNQSFSGNGQPIKKLTITISDGATFTNVSAYDNGGKYTMSKSSDNKTVTITFNSNLGWASPESALKVGNIQWSGSQNVQITYGFEYM